jgi:hypothetical protein
MSDIRKQLQRQDFGSVSEFPTKINATQHKPIKRLNQNLASESYLKIKKRH